MQNLGVRCQVSGTRSLLFIFCLLSTLFFLLSTAWAERVAILPLKDRSQIETLKEEKAYQMLAELLLGGNFTLIEEGLIKNVISLKTLEALGEITPQVANSLGQILEADIIATGSFEYLKGFELDSLFLQASFINTGVRDLGSLPGLKVIDSLEASISYGGGATKFVEEGERIGSFGLALFVPKIEEPVRVYIDEKLAGTTPLIIKGLKAGRHRISLRRDLLEREIEINIEPDTSAFCHIALLAVNPASIPKPSLVGEERALSINTVPAKARVYLNDSLKGVTPVVIRDLRPGIYKIRLTMTGYEEVKRRIIFKDGYKLSLRLRPTFSQEHFFLSPSAKIAPSPELLRIPTPFTLARGNYYLSLDYPTGPVIRYGLKPNLELRLNGPGLGMKVCSRRLGIDVYWTAGDLYHKEAALSVSGVYILKIDSPIGILSLYPGVRFLEYKEKAEGFDEGLGLFLGLDLWATDRLKFLLEYDRFEGGAVGFFYDLGKNFTLSLGGGLNPESKVRADGNLSYYNAW